jgi:hypothetical protein
LQAGQELLNATLFPVGQQNSDHVLFEKLKNGNPLCLYAWPNPLTLLSKNLAGYRLWLRWRITKPITRQSGVASIAANRFGQMNTRKRGQPNEHQITGKKEAHRNPSCSGKIYQVGDGRRMGSRMYREGDHPFRIWQCAPREVPAMLRRKMGSAHTILHSGWQDQRDRDALHERDAAFFRGRRLDPMDTFVGERLYWGLLTADPPKRHSDGAAMAASGNSCGRT